MKDVSYITTEKQLDSAIQYISKQKLWAFDTETNTLDPHVGDVLLIQIGNFYKQYVFNCFELKSCLHKLFKHLLNTHTTLITHNAKFDYEMILGHYGIVFDLWKDTMLAEQLLNQGKSKVKVNLDAVLEKYLNVKLNKSLQLSFADMKPGHEFTQDQIDYAAQDVEFLHQLFEKLSKLLNARDMNKLADLEFATAVATGDLEYNGIYIDRVKWKALLPKAEEEAAIAKIALDTHFDPYCDKDLFGGVCINYNSPAQIIPALQSICHMKITSTADAALSQYEEDFPVISALMEYRKAVKKISTYGDKFLSDNIHPVTNRIHSDFKQLGADSGRFTSSKPNMNNIPRKQEYRTPFEAQEEEWQIISADFSQQELRLLTQLSREPKFKEALERKLDLHCFTGSFIYNIPYEKFFLPSGKRDPAMDKQYRDPVKSLNFGR